MFRFLDQELSYSIQLLWNEMVPAMCPSLGGCGEVRFFFASQRNFVRVSRERAEGFLWRHPIGTPLSLIKLGGKLIKVHLFSLRNEINLSSLNLWKTSVEQLFHVHSKCCYKRIIIELEGTKTRIQIQVCSKRD